MVHVEKISAGLIFITLAVAIASLAVNIIILTKENDHKDTATQPPPTCPPPPKQQPGGKVSDSKGYKEAADQLLQGLDLSVDPCEDFYQFTCAKYLADTPIPPGRSRIGTYDQSQVIVNQAVVSGIEKDRTNTQLSKTEVVLRTAYDACLLDARQKQRADRSKDIYARFIKTWGGVPAINGTNWQTLPNAQFWQKLGTDEGSLSLQTLIGSFVSADWEDAANHALYLNQGPLPNPRDFYVQPPFLKQISDYRDDVINIFKYFAQDIGSTVDSNALTDAATKVVQFEIALALAMVPDDLQRNYQQQYNPHTLADLTQKYKNIDWNSYLTGLLAGSSVANQASTLKYIVVQPSYFGVLDDIFAGGQYPQSTMVNFVVLRLLQNNANYIKGEFKDIVNRNKQFQGRGIAADVDENAQFCINILTGYFPYATGYVYVKNINNRDEVQKDVATQTEYVISSFLGKDMIKSLPWITASTLDHAQKKAKNLVRNVGWPHWFNFEDKGAALDNYNKRYLGIAGNDFFSILTQLQQANQLTENFDLLSKKVDRGNFGGSPATVNAWYIPERNSITFPFAAFNPPYYRFDFPQAYNYAGQGGTGGHELSHGFDDEGVQYGPEGDLNQPLKCDWDRCGWMDDNSTYGFINMAQCVVSQYSEKCCPLKTGSVHCANGATTQGENLADLAGQQAAFLAYRQYVKEKRNGVEEDRLPGLEQFTPNQIFWITYGFSWCMNQQADNLVNQLLTNPHAPGSCRVNQVMQDIPQFGQDFNCKRGSPMYPQPEGRCKVWTGN